MKHALTCLPLVVFVLLGCDAPQPATRVSQPDAAAGTSPDTAARAATVNSPAEIPGRGFRTDGYQIVADTFEVRHHLRDGQLTLTLDTDLGDATEVFVSVGRTYREPGNSQDYLIEYFNQGGTVGMWRSGKTIDLTATDFAAELEKLQRMMAAQGEPFTVASVSDGLKIDFAVYPGQKPPFVSGNANLTGRAVSIRGGNRVIEKDIFVRYPVDTPTSRKPAR